MGGGAQLSETMLNIIQIKNNYLFIPDRFGGIGNQNILEKDKKLDKEYIFQK